MGRDNDMRALYRALSPAARALTVAEHVARGDLKVDRRLTLTMPASQAHATWRHLEVMKDVHMTLGSRGIALDHLVERLQWQAIALLAITAWADEALWHRDLIQQHVREPISASEHRRRVRAVKRGYSPRKVAVRTVAQQRGVTETEAGRLLDRQVKRGSPLVLREGTGGVEFRVDELYDWLSLDPAEEVLPEWVEACEVVPDSRWREDDPRLELIRKVTNAPPLTYYPPPGDSTRSSWPSTPDVGSTREPFRRAEESWREGWLLAWSELETIVGIRERLAKVYGVDEFPTALDDSGRVRERLLGLREQARSLGPLELPHISEEHIDSESRSLVGPAERAFRLPSTTSGSHGKS